MIRFPITDSRMTVKVETEYLRVTYRGGKTTVSMANEHGHWHSFYFAIEDTPFEEVLNTALEMDAPFDQKQRILLLERLPFGVSVSGQNLTNAKAKWLGRNR